jgi:glycosyltransferase involved in cell wall biosynthesis
LVLNNPNNFHYIKQQALSHKGALHNKPYILGLGRLVPSKNFSLLIQAYNYALQHYSIHQDLIIVGEGNDRNTVESEVVRLKLTDRVHFKGAQLNPFPWYQQADLFVLSSKSEGLGMVLVESLACDTKVVSTDCRGGVRQVMNGELEQFLAQETPESLGRTIEYALKFERTTEFNEFVRETLQHFDGTTIVNNYLKEFT